MNKYEGTISDLKLIVEKYGLSGTWSETHNAHKFNSIDGGILLWYTGTKTLQSQGKIAPQKTIDSLIGHIVGRPQEASSLIKTNEVQQKPVLFVVYGHDETSREQLEFILTKLGVEHFILAKSSGEGKTIIEALEGHIGQNGTANAGIVLFTPDDMGYAVRDGETALKARARQNVILEMGMLMAKLGRRNTILLIKGDIERPSDTDGILYRSYKNHVKEVAKFLIERLEASGFNIDAKKVIDVI